MKKTYIKYYFAILGIIMLWGMGCSGKGAKEHNRISEPKEAVRTSPNRSEPNKRITIKNMGVLDAKLDKDYPYAGFEASSDYLTWFKLAGSRVTVYFYDIDSKKIRTFKLRQGSGPGEYNTIRGSVLVGGELYVLDPNNVKLIPITIEGKILKDIILPFGLPARISSKDGELILMGVVDPKTLFHIYNPETHAYSKVSATGLNPLKEFKNITYKDGHITVSGNKLIHLTRYFPNIYIYNLDTKKFIKKIQFDKSKVEEGGVGKSPNGVKSFSPPSKVDILNQDVASVPGFPDRIFLLAKGASNNRSYGLDKLFEYNFKREKFVATHHLDTEATEIAVNDHYLFVYSREEHKIFQYEIIHSK